MSGGENVFPNRSPSDAPRNDTVIASVGQPFSTDSGSFRGEACTLLLSGESASRPGMFFPQDNNRANHANNTIVGREEVRREPPRSYPGSTSTNGRTPGALFQILSYTIIWPVGGYGRLWLAR
jgi:hypothetical protein